MATNVWIGSAPDVAQVETDTLSVTWIIGEHITVTIGSKAYVYSITSATISVITAALATALTALDTSIYPEFAEITWGSSATTLTATSKVPGKPFVYSISTNSAAGVITPAATTASSGKYDWSTAANWSLAAVPVSTNNVILDREGGIILYGLAQSGVTLASLRCVAKQFTLGLSETNSDATPYAEYRTTSLAIGCTTTYVNSSNCRRFKMNYGSVQNATLVDATGTGADANVPAALFLGTHASNAYTFNGGSIGIGFFSSTAYTALTVDVSGGASVTLGAGGTVGTVNNRGGSITTYCPIVTALNHPTVSGAARTTQYGTGGVGQVTLQGGVYANNGAGGTVGGNTVIGGSGLMTLDGGQGAITITNAVSLEAPGAGFSDALGRVVTGAVISMVNCASNRLGIKPNSKLTVTYL